MHRQAALPALSPQKSQARVQGCRGPPDAAGFCSREQVAGGRPGLPLRLQIGVTARPLHHLKPRTQPQFLQRGRCRQRGGVVADDRARAG